MKYHFLFIALVIPIVSCNRPLPAMQQTDLPIIGTWQLVSDIIITKGDTAVTFPVKGKDEVMIKIYNHTHFSFFKHDKKQGKVSVPVYDSGAGTYKLTGEEYTEHLEYCNYREWENHDFSFKLSIRNDTLVQRGIEKIDSLHINHEIIETYIRKH